MRLDELQAQYAAAAKLQRRPADRIVVKEVPADTLRPGRLAEFIGQDDLRAQLQIMISAAQSRGETLGHILFSGPGGLGKTTLSLLMANEMDSRLIATTAPTLGQEPLVKMLSSLTGGEILFIDEIHRMSRRTEELLYAAMEDGCIDANTPTGFVRRKIAPFTLIGGTTLPGMMSESFKDRFESFIRMEFYPIGDIHRIVLRSAGVLGVEVTDDAAQEIAIRSRNVPRVANQLLRRLRDYAEVHGNGTIDTATAVAAFGLFNIDALGLDKLDREIMIALVCRFASGPIGLENLSIAVGEATNTVDKDVEPFLVRLGLMARTPRGRIATEVGRQHVEDILREEGTV